MKQLLFFLFLCCSIHYADCQTYIGTQKGKLDFPDIEILSLDSNSIFNSKKITHERNVVFLFFQTTCDHCKALTKSIVQNKEKFNNVQLVMLSFETTDKIKGFFKSNSLSKIKHLIIGKDFRYSGMKKFQFESFPFCVVFSKNHKYLGSLEREFTIASIWNIMEKK